MAAQRSAPSPAGHGGARRAALAFFLGRGSGQLWALHRPCWCAVRVGAPGTPHVRDRGGARTAAARTVAERSEVRGSCVGSTHVTATSWPRPPRAPAGQPDANRGPRKASPVSEGPEGGARWPRGGGLARARLLRKPPAPAPQQPVGARGTATSPRAGRRSGSAQGACQAHRSKLKACRAERVSPQGPGMERGCSPQFPGGMGAACPCNPSKM